MLRSAICGIALLAGYLLAFSGCGEVEYVEACKNAQSADACMSCCVDSGYTDWSYNASYAPPCGCIE